MTQPHSPRSFAARGGWWVVMQSILMLTTVVLAVLWPGDWTRTAVSAAGLGLFALGGCIGIAGVIALGTNRTPFPEPRARSKLVLHGIYARIRHPLYTSVMLASVGWALIWQSMAALAVALTLIPFFHAKARREEAYLRRTFSSYTDYAQRVPRFLPRLATRHPPESR